LFARLLKALLESKEKTLREELNAQNKRVLERELVEMQRRSVLQNQVLAAKRYVEEELVTLKCPRCRRAFADFSGCCALTCQAAVARSAPGAYRTAATTPTRACAPARATPPAASCLTARRSSQPPNASAW
jgi:hypothetical protein